MESVFKGYPLFPVLGLKIDVLHCIVHQFSYLNGRVEWKPAPGVIEGIDMPLTMAL